MGKWAVWFFLGCATLAALCGAAHADCAAPAYQARLLTPTDAPLPLDMPLLVSLEVRPPAHHAEGDLRVGQLPHLRVVRDDVVEDLVVEDLGAGLLAYHAASPLSPGVYLLTGIGAGVSLRVDERTLPPHTPYRVTRAEHAVYYNANRTEYRWRDVVELSRPLAEAEVALLLEGPGGVARVAGRSGTNLLGREGAQEWHCSADRYPRERRLAKVITRSLLVDHYGRAREGELPLAPLATRERREMAQWERDLARDEEARRVREERGCSAAGVTARGRLAAWWGLAALAVALRRLW